MSNVIIYTTEDGVSKIELSTVNQQLTVQMEGCREFSRRFVAVVILEASTFRFGN